LNEVWKPLIEKLCQFKPVLENKRPEDIIGNNMRFKNPTRVLCKFKIALKSGRPEAVL
jgi:hypothetical protein